MTTFGPHTVLKVSRRGRGRLGRLRTYVAAEECPLSEVILRREAQPGRYPTPSGGRRPPHPEGVSPAARGTPRPGQRSREHPPRQGRDGPYIYRCPCYASVGEWWLILITIIGGGNRVDNPSVALPSHGFWADGWEGGAPERGRGGRKLTSGPWMLRP